MGENETKPSVPVGIAVSAIMPMPAGSRKNVEKEMM